MGEIKDSIEELGRRKYLIITEKKFYSFETFYNEAVHKVIRAI